MKKFLVVLVFFGSIFIATAQEQFVKGDVGIGAALTLGELKSYGISASFEPKFFFTPQIAAGLRFEGDVLFGGKIDADNGQADVNTSARTAILLKGEYYISESSTRMFVGIMAGRYTQSNVGGGSSGSASIAVVNNFGFAPEVGVTFNNFRISGIYHFVPGTDLVAVSAGDPVEVSRNYLVIQMGFKAFKIDVK